MISTERNHLQNIFEPLGAINLGVSGKSKIVLKRSKARKPCGHDERTRFAIVAHAARRPIIQGFERVRTNQWNSTVTTIFQ